MNPSNHNQEPGAEQTDNKNGTSKDQIRLKLPGISVVIITTTNKIINLTVILCVFILVFTLVVKYS